MTKPRALVWGLGRFGGGLAAALHLHRRGFEVAVIDRQGRAALAPSLQELARAGGPLAPEVLPEEPRSLDGAALLVVNPAVPAHHPLLAEAARRGLPQTQELDLFLAAWPGRTAAVTGTNGKSSTAGFLAAALEAAGFAVRLGGNIGRSLLPDAAAAAPGEIAVLEVSSFQAARLGPEPRFDLVLFTRITADHLSWHGGLEAYRAAKLGLLARLAEGGTVLGDAGCPVLRAAARHDRRLALVDLDRGPGCRLAAPGAFQRRNAALALAGARALGARAAAARRGLAAFPGLPHRARPLPARHGRRFVDNGVSTLPESTRPVLEEELRRAPVHWIAGGRRKERDDEAWRALAALGPRSIQLFGEAAAGLAAVLAGCGARVQAHPDLPSALAAAFRVSRPGETLLFSPACSSYDAYANFAERAAEAARWWAAVAPPPAASAKP